jgi:hypothetical protein
MQVVHLGLWKVKPDADPAMLQRAAANVERFTHTIPGRTEALLASLYVPDIGQADQETFGNLDSFEEMARGLQLHPLHGLRERGRTQGLRRTSGPHGPTTAR